MPQSGAAVGCGRSGLALRHVSLSCSLVSGALVCAAPHPHLLPRAGLPACVPPHPPGPNPLPPTPTCTCLSAGAGSVRAAASHDRRRAHAAAQAAAAGLPAAAHAPVARRGLRRAGGGGAGRHFGLVCAAFEGSSAGDWDTQTLGSDHALVLVPLGWCCVVGTHSKCASAALWGCGAWQGFSVGSCGDSSGRRGARQVVQGRGLLVAHAQPTARPCLRCDMPAQGPTLDLQSWASVPQGLLSPVPQGLLLGTLPWPPS